MDHELKGIGLEVVGRCNASCQFCTWGHNRDVTHTNIHTGEVIKRSTGKIDLELVDEIFRVHSPTSLIFTGLSEPFLAPDRVFYVADKLEEAGGKFAVYSNGNLLNEEILRKLLGYKGFSSLHISLNAVSEEVRKEVMGLSMAKAEENLKLYLELRGEMGRDSDAFCGCVLMLTGSNRPEEVVFKQKWSNIFSKYPNCNDPGVFHTTNWNGTVPTPWVKSKGRQYCNQWDILSPTISVDGQMYLCCYSPHLTFGHCLDSDAVNSWIKRKEIFKVSRENANTPPPKHLCGGCSGWRNVTWA